MEDPNSAGGTIDQEEYQAILDSLDMVAAFEKDKDKRMMQLSLRDRLSSARDRVLERAAYRAETVLVENPKFEVRAKFFVTVKVIK